MAGAGFCSQKCGKQQDAADRESAELEAELEDYDPNAENTLDIEQPSLTRGNLT